VVRERFDMLVQPIFVEPLQRLDNARVESTPPLLEHTTVGDLVGQRMLERVLEVGKEARFVEELGGL
jgi:hypothetical protein